MSHTTGNEQHPVDASAPPGMTGQRKLIARTVLCTLILAAGVLVRIGLGTLRAVPTPAELPPPQVRVEVRAVYPENVPVVISGFGEVRARDSLALTPKAAGEVVYLHPNLEVGNVINEGELLYRVDQRDYVAAREQGMAQVERLRIMVALLNQQYASDKNRLETVRRTRDIALEEFERDTTLYRDRDVGSASMVNLTEIQYRQAQDAFDQVEQAIALYPMRIREAEAGLRAAEAALQMAELSLERTEAYAPFTARVQHKQIELGQAVAPGLVVLLLANDQALEVSVPIDSRDARQWLPFVEETDTPGPANWFRTIEPAPCTITWTEDDDAQWTGHLHRVERFDPMTRTVTLAIRVEENTQTVAGMGLPLVEGMFCRVEIPGRMMEGVYRLPRWTVSYDGNTYIAEGNRLRRRAVNVARSQGEETYVDTGLEPGELVVITRLVDPVPGLLLEYDLPETTLQTVGEAQ